MSVSRSYPLGRSRPRRRPIPRTKVGSSSCEPAIAIEPGLITSNARTTKPKAVRMVTPLLVVHEERMSTPTSNRNSRVPAVMHHLSRSSFAIASAGCRIPLAVAQCVQTGSAARVRANARAARARKFDARVPSAFCPTSALPKASAAACSLRLM